MTDTPEQPQTASCVVPLTALGITIVLLIIAIPISKNLVGNPLKELEKEAAPIATEYLQQSAKNQTTAHADTTKFDEPAFKTKLVKLVGPIKFSRITKLGTEKTTPPTIYITFNLDGEKGNGISTIALQKQNNIYKVINAGVYPR